MRKYILGLLAAIRGAHYKTQLDNLIKEFKKHFKGQWHHVQRNVNRSCAAIENETLKTTHEVSEEETETISQPQPPNDHQRASNSSIKSKSFGVKKTKRRKYKKIEGDAYGLDFDGNPANLDFTKVPQKLRHIYVPPLFRALASLDKSRKENGNAEKDENSEKRGVPATSDSNNQESEPVSTDRANSGSEEEPPVIITRDGLRVNFWSRWTCPGIYGRLLDVMTCDQEGIDPIGHLNGDDVDCSDRSNGTSDSGSESSNGSENADTDSIGDSRTGRGRKRWIAGKGPRLDILLDGAIEDDGSELCMRLISAITGVNEITDQYLAELGIDLNLPPEGKTWSDVPWHERPKRWTGRNDARYQFRIDEFPEETVTQMCEWLEEIRDKLNHWFPIYKKELKYSSFGPNSPEENDPYNPFEFKREDRANPTETDQGSSTATPPRGSSSSKKEKSKASRGDASESKHSSKDGNPSTISKKHSNDAKKNETQIAEDGASEKDLPGTIDQRYENNEAQNNENVTEQERSNGTEKETLAHAAPNRKTKSKKQNRVIQSDAETKGTPIITYYRGAKLPVSVQKSFVSGADRITAIIFSDEKKIQGSDTGWWINYWENDVLG